MIESADRVVTSAEQRAGHELLKALSAHRETLRHYAADSIAARRSALRLASCEHVYDSLPVEDRQVRDALDDALAVAGWKRVA